MDLEALTRIKPPVALHRDRIRDSDSDGFRYLVLADGQHTIGFACLVFKRPSSWSDADDLSHLPQVVDIVIAQELRGKGYGSAFIKMMEDICARRGLSKVYPSVDPIENSRAHALYLKLGYRQLQDKPVKAHWKFEDSEGNLHKGNSWNIDMVKEL